MEKVGAIGPELRTWKVTLAYDGTDYRGWQVQPGELTVQGELQAALGRVTGENPLPQGSGRTDAGVHAMAQVASFALQAPIPEENLARALNRTLPASIRVLEARRMPDDFHARHSALAKTYEYRVLTSVGQRGEGCSPFQARYVWPCPWALDLGKMQGAARSFLGEHDFTSFAASDPDLTMRERISEEDDEDSLAVSTVRTIFDSTWNEQETEGARLHVYRVRGNGFLHHMVRNLVGTMIDVGRGQTSAEAMADILAARSRGAAGPTAPARGLFLHSVEYGAEFA